VQSWDTANKATELSDFSVCTTWGVKDKNVYLVGLLRQRLEYPALKRAVREQQNLYHGTVFIGFQCITAGSTAKGAARNTMPLARINDRK
jgi:phage terminase large subunit-like protein